MWPASPGIVVWHSSAKEALERSHEMVVLRLKRMGRRHRPFYRVCAMDKRSPRDGRVIEQLGWFDPLVEESKQTELKIDRINYWLSVGAQPSPTVATLLRRADCDPKSGKKIAAAPSTP
jgi:small subunit ribosomal protein S16